MGHTRKKVKTGSPEHYYRIGREVLRRHRAAFVAARPKIYSRMTAIQMWNDLFERNAEATPTIDVKRWWIAYRKEFGFGLNLDNLTIPPSEPVTVVVPPEEQAA